MPLPRSRPRRSALVVTILTTSLVLAPAATPLGAQQPHPARAGRLGLVLTGGGTGLADAISTQCGNRANGSGAEAFESAAALLARPARWVVLQADLRAANVIDGAGCTDIGVPVDTVYARDLHRDDPFLSTVLRAGVETPPGLPLVRAMVGAGLGWGGRRLPLTVASLGAGTRGRRVRVLAEAERLWTRVRAEERTHDMASPFPAPPVVRPIRFAASWYTLRVGVEVPLGGTP